MARWWQQRFDLVEIGLVAVVLAGGVWVYSEFRSRVIPSPETLYLEDRYGPGRNSEHAEEWIIRDFFQDRRGGVFVDVGANHYKDRSNTYYLEATLGWTGLAVEPIRDFEPDYAAYRPGTTFRAFFVSAVSNEEAILYVQSGGGHASSATRAFTEQYGSVSELVTPTITLNDLLAAEGIERFDFLNMDIELHEPEALAGFDLARYRPALVCIEAHAQVRQQILDYFHRHDYVVVGRYLRADAWNLYFMPAG